MNPEKMMDSLGKELDAALKAMSKVKTVEEKMAYSQIVRNLCESLGVFLKLASDLMEDEFDDFDEDGR